MKAILARTALVALLTPAMVQAGKLTCLTGTDPSVTNDRSQIAAVQAMVDAACVCARFDGSAGSAHGSYNTCAFSTIDSEIASCHLRSQCGATVKEYYATSTCGRQSRSFGVMVPCIKKGASGKVTCAITPSAKCVESPGKYTKTACTDFSTCIAAADTNNDGVIGPGDTGACRTGSLVTPTSTQTLAPGVPTNTPIPPTATFGPLPRFVDNGDGTITDYQTGLMWEKKDQAGGLHQFTSKHKWAGTCTQDGLLPTERGGGQRLRRGNGGRSRLLRVQRRTLQYHNDLGLAGTAQCVELRRVQRLAHPEGGA